MKKKQNQSTGGQDSSFLKEQAGQTTGPKEQAERDILCPSMSRQGGLLTAFQEVLKHLLHPNHIGFLHS